MNELPIETLKDGRYQIEGVLGAGGMSVVFKALDTRIGVHRAIKLLHPKYARDPRIRERFENEAYAQAGLRHPNILMVHDVVDEDIGVYLVMEMAEQGSLMGRVRSLGPMSPQETAQVGIAMAGALSVAHAEGMVHRDIKPENILVDRLGNLKLADFGIARVVTRQHELTRTGTVMGTWAYMPPEQRDSAKLVDARSDIYALGSTLYFLATGRQPFDLHNTEAYAQAFADFPLALAAVIQKSTRFSPDDRYSSCDELRAELSAIIEGLEVEPFVDFEPPTSPPETQVPELGELSTYIIAARAAARAAQPDTGGAGGHTAVPDGGSTSTFMLDAPPPPRQLATPASPARGATLVAEADLLEPEPEPPSAPPAAPSAAAVTPPPARSGISGSQLLIFVAGILVAVLAVVVLLPRLLQPSGTAEVDPALGDLAAAPQVTAPTDGPPPVEPEVEEPVADAVPAEPPAEPTGDAAADRGTATEAAGTSRSSSTTSNSAGAAASGSSASAPRVITIQPLTPAAADAATDDAGSQLLEPTGTVVVKTVPSGATVRLGGVALAKTGRGYELPVGNHLLEIVSADGETYRTPVSVTRGGSVEICYSFDTNSACSAP